MQCICERRLNSHIIIYNNFVQFNKLSLRNFLISLRQLFWPEATTANLAFKIQHLTMGTSNRVFKCGIEESPAVLLLRVSGEGASVLVNRSDELEMIRRLSDSKEGARLYATFENGMCIYFEVCNV